MWHRALADLVLLAHAGVVLFIVLGLVLVLAGGARGWAWVRNPWLRLVHLGAIAVVIAQAWLGVLCPLTTWEMRLRAAAGDALYPGSFVAHWVSAALYYEAPAWVFTLCYTLFGAAVAGSWVWVRPRPLRRRGER